MSLRPLSLSSSENRVLGIGLAMLLHAALLAAWQASRQRAPDDERQPVFTQWVHVPDSRPRPATRDVPAPAEHRHATVAAPTARTGQAVTSGIEQPTAEPDVAVPAVGIDVTPVEGGARLSVEQALREAGAIERTLRKSSKAYIVAPPDSPQIRMARGFAEAAAVAPGRWWEAPQIVELVTDGGDGARRTRVVTAGGIYCITERSPATSIDMIEKFGKQRITNCGHEHEQPVNAQEWRTARD
jgi:hypothetical protein